MKRSGYHVLLAVPTRGQIQWQTCQRLEQIRDSVNGMRPILYQPGNLSVAMTRNRIVKRFLESDCDTLVMVDDDVVPPPHLLEALLPVPAGYGIVAIPHPKPVGGHLILTAYRQTAGGLANLTSFREGWNDCDAVATGCCAIARTALEQLGPAPFRVAHDPDDEVTSDDFLLCADLRAAGLKVGCWFDGHYADHVHAANLAALLEQTASR